VQEERAFASIESCDGTFQLLCPTGFPMLGRSEQKEHLLPLAAIDHGPVPKLGRSHVTLC